MRPHRCSNRRRARPAASFFAVVLLAALPASALAQAIDHYHAGRQAWFAREWSAAVRQFSLALADSLEPSLRTRALFDRADALTHLHECARAAEDVAELRHASTALTAADRARLDRMIADCESRPATGVRSAPTLPLRVGIDRGMHGYSTSSRWRSSWGAELAFAPGSLQGFARGGWIGRNDNRGELGMRLLAPRPTRLRPWVEASAGLERLRPGNHPFTYTISIPQWGIVDSSGALPPEPTFHGTFLGAGAGLDLRIRGGFGVGAAWRWRSIHWKSDLPATLPGNEQEFSGYLFAR